MKENVDLTEKRDFFTKSKEIRTPQVNISTLGRRGYRIDVGTFLDRFKAPTDGFYISDDKGAVLQGNSSCRASKRVCREFEMGNICDRCGIAIKPYVNDCLCPLCAKLLYRKKPDLFDLKLF